MHYRKAIRRIKGDLSMDAAGMSGKEAVERMPLGSHLLKKGEFISS